MSARDETKSRRKMILGGSAFLLGLLTEDAVAAKARKAGRKSTTGRAGKKGKRQGVAVSKPRVPSGPISGDTLFRDIISYYNIGEHRTATESDLRTSDWISKELRSAGLATTFQRFALKQFFPKEVSLKIGGTTVRTFPLWPPRVTEPSPLRARLVPFAREGGPRALKGAIAFVRFPADARAAITRGSVYVDLIASAAKSGASAVVAVTEGPSGEIVALNVEPNTEPWLVPVVLVGPRDESLLVECAKNGLEAALVLEGQEQDAVAKNVIGRVSRGEKLFVISTPQSGWFRCAAERGPGIALFLGLARWAVKRASNTSFLFVSTSGHELGALGMRAFQKELAPRKENVVCWLHLGAGIASFSWEDQPNGPRRLKEAESRRYLMTSPQFVDILKETFASLAGLTPVTGRAVGEFELLMAGGYRTFGIAAGHRFHHTPADSPEMTGPEILEPVATALVRSIEAIEAG